MLITLDGAQGVHMSWIQWLGALGRKQAPGLTAHGPGATPARHVRSIVRPVRSINGFGSVDAEWLSRRSDTGQEGLYTHHGSQTDNTGPQGPTWPPLWLLGPPLGPRPATTHKTGQFTWCANGSCRMRAAAREGPGQRHAHQPTCPPHAQPCCSRNSGNDGHPHRLTVARDPEYSSRFAVGYAV